MGKKSLNLYSAKYINIEYEKRYRLKKIGLSVGAIIIVAIIIISAAFIKQEKINGQKIKSIIETVDIILNQNDSFSLPKQVAARMKDNSSKPQNVSWNLPNDIDTSLPGLKTYIGKVAGYSKSIKYNINISPCITMNEFNDIDVNNNTLKYSINFNKAVRWIWINVIKDYKKNDQFVLTGDGSFNGKVYLPFGKGRYQVNILTRSDNDPEGAYDEFKVFSVNSDDDRDMNFLMPSKYVESDSPEIIKLAKDITKNCYSEMDKTKAIHEWVTQNINYDDKAVESNNVKEYSALETLHSKRAVCNGYANLTAALNRAVNIRTKVCSGTATTGGFFGIGEKTGGHAWNETYIDEKWIIQDTTWDSGSDMVGTSNQFRYFNPDSKWFNKSHKKESELDYDIGFPNEN